MKLLVYSSLYPNAVQTRHGIFVETRLRQLLQRGGIEARVVAPVPWFPSSNPRFGHYADFARVPERETRHGIEILHPRYPLIPKFGMTLAPILMALSTWNTVRQEIARGHDFDVLDVHYYYPDGVAGALIAKWLDKPLTITARGTDINLIPQYTLPRKMIVWAAERAAASVTVCEALKQEMVALGAEADKIFPYRNGVNLELFHPGDRDALREQYGIQRPTLLSVGHLVERKGHHLIIDAMKSLPGVDLLIAGDGELEQQLKQQVAEAGLGEQVRFLGALTQEQLADIYCAVDIMVLASSREGWANVLLESMACGTPVAATDIWGTPEVVRTPEAGMLIPDRSAESIAETVTALLNDLPDRAATRRYAEQFSWQETTANLEAMFQRVSVAGD